MFQDRHLGDESSAAADGADWSTTDVECTQCRVLMTPHVGSGQHIRYFHCASCHRWLASNYSEVFRVDAKMRRRPRSQFGQRIPSAAARVADAFARFAAPDFRALFASASSLDEVRSKYRMLARVHHPDAGGSRSTMQRLNEAYEHALAEFGVGIDAPVGVAGVRARRLLRAS